MQHIIRRCKHCGKEYVYCTYGNGPDWGTEEGCSMDYCGECQTAIKDALNKIPIRYIGRWQKVELDDETRNQIDDQIRPKYHKENDNKDENESKSLLNGFSMCVLSPYQNIETIIVNFTKYQIMWDDDDDPYNKAVERWSEYDQIENKFTGKEWSADKREGYTYTRGSGTKFGIDQDLVPVRAMEPPTAILSFIDPKFS